MAHGLGNALEAAQLVDRSNIKFLFVGPGAERATLVQEAASRGLKNVIFVPVQPKEEMPRFWSLSDVALVHLKDVPLFSITIPSKIFEAMGMGIPMILAAPDGEASRIVLGERAGLWVPAGDPRALAAALQQLESDRELRADLAKWSLAAAPRHSRERQARELLECFETVLRPALPVVEVER
jgi:glycosyltransferase involved in cell wall biosynthesis